MEAASLGVVYSFFWVWYPVEEEEKRRWMAAKASLTRASAVASASAARLCSHFSGNISEKCDKVEDEARKVFHSGGLVGRGE